MSRRGMRLRYRQRAAEKLHRHVTITARDSVVMMRDGVPTAEAGVWFKRGIEDPAFERDVVRFKDRLGIWGATRLRFFVDRDDAQLGNEQVRERNEIVIVSPHTILDGGSDFVIADRRQFAEDSLPGKVAVDRWEFSTPFFPILMGRRISFGLPLLKSFDWWVDAEVAFFALAEDALPKCSVALRRKRPRDKRAQDRKSRFYSAVSTTKESPPSKPRIPPRTVEFKNPLSGKDETLWTYREQVTGKDLRAQIRAGQGKVHEYEFDVSLIARMQDRYGSSDEMLCRIGMVTSLPKRIPVPISSAHGERNHSPGRRLSLEEHPDLVAEILAEFGGTS